MKRTITLLLLLILSSAAFANHIKGGWIYYKYVGPGTGTNSKYLLTIKLYRDCHLPTPGQNDDIINVTVYPIGSRLPYTVVSAPIVRQYGLEKETFSPCITSPPEICYIILQYETTVELPPNINGYTLAFQRCCRIIGIENVRQPTNEIGITYTATIPGTQNGATWPQNTPVQFSEKDTAVICFNSPFQLDYSAVDADADSLSYELTSALLGSDLSDPAPAVTPPPPYNSVAYTNVFSAKNPFGTGISINSSTGIISGIAPANIGEYVIAVAATEYRDGKIVTVTRKELHIVVANCGLAVASLAEGYINCATNNITISNAVSSTAIHSYYWDFGVGNVTDDTSVLARPTYVYQDSGTYTVTLVVNKGEECSDSTTTQVKIYPGFVPNFNTIGSCYLSPFQFNDASVSQYGIVNQWQWNFGNPNVSTDTSMLQNPFYTYPAPSSVTATLVVGDDKGCRDSISKIITIRDKPPIRLPFRDTLICSIDSLQLFVDGLGEFAWLANDSSIINQNSSTPIVFPKDSSVYVVTLTDRGCINRDSVRVNVLDSITVQISPDTIICRSDSIRLRPESQGLQYEWSPTIGVSNPNIKFPVVAPLSNTTYEVIARLGKCVASGRTQITVIPYPQVFAGNDTSICTGSTASLSGSTTASSFTWSPLSTLSNNTLQPIASPRQTTAYILTARDTLGCPKPSHDTMIVTVIPPVRAFAGNDTSVVVGQSLQLQASGGILYRWLPPTGMSNSSISNPVIQVDRFLDSITYIVHVSTPEGCSADDSITVKIFKSLPDVFVPAAFSPNTDGHNDGMRPILVGIKQLLFFRIYNRWGQLVFETDDHRRSWDGTIGGRKQPSGAFVYVAQAVDYTGKVLLRKGTIVLVR